MNRAVEVTNRADEVTNRADEVMNRAVEVTNRAGEVTNRAIEGLMGCLGSVICILSLKAETFRDVSFMISEDDLWAKAIFSMTN